MNPSVSKFLYLSYGASDPITDANVRRFSLQIANYLEASVDFFSLPNTIKYDLIGLDDLDEDLQNQLRDFKQGMIIVNHVLYYNLLSHLLGKEKCAIVYHKMSVEHLSTDVNSLSIEVKKAELKLMRQADWLLTSSKKMIDFYMETLGYREHKYSIIPQLACSQKTDQHCKVDSFYLEGTQLLAYDPIPNRVIKIVKSLLRNGRCKLTVVTSNEAYLNKFSRAQQDRIRIVRPSDGSLIELLNYINFCLLFEDNNVRSIVNSQKLQAVMLSAGVDLVTTSKINIDLKKDFGFAYHELGDNLMTRSKESRVLLQEKVKAGLNILSDNNVFKLRNLRNLFLDHVNRINP